ncbi:Iron-sulfur cluster assembly protein SufD [Lunatimonas lonarensis]|uniref:Iron-sulfur cluster assembly protein SufD n=1 Tax=Lunatimonas lonarensis TaxID=1232681 RepID=R7ZTE3_9BACT|nr:Fe-S cluster assembly protein SufD [Lunatimonas lonarensis]EON77416.1 Iron-sulfur cluster assembly protein SufD [Lunatimonas lonarensis]
MTAIVKQNDTLASAFLEAFYSHKPAAPWAEMAIQGAGFIQKDGFPAAKSEEYKFTPITKRIESTIENVGHASPSAHLDHDLVRRHLIPNLDAHLLVFNNGSWSAELSSNPKDEFTTSLFSDGVMPQELGTIAKPSKDPFVALNQMAFRDGLYVDIPANTRVSKPILVLHLISSSSTGQTVHPRLFLRTGVHSEVTVIERMVNLDESPVLVNGVMEVAVGQNSHVHHYKLQDESKQTIEVNNTEVNITKDATFTSLVVSLQGLLIRNNLTLNLLDSNTVGNMYGLYLLNGTTHVDNHTNVDHTKPHAESNELYKGILADRSRGVFNGKIFVRQDAQKTNAFQQNNNILLSEDAVINTKPQLEIWADDVKCSHGCTTGQLDEEALFYLRARGISKEAGKALLLYAFAGEVLDHIKNDDFREYCVNLIQERLGSNYSV